VLFSDMGITMLGDDAQQQVISNTGIEAPSLSQDNELRLSIRRGAIIQNCSIVLKERKGNKHC
jgi:hypothetical protein